MKQALNTSDIKKTNRRLILDAIYACRTTTRTQLARDLELSKPTVSDNLEPLLAEGVVSEIGESRTGPAGGRKSILLQFNPMHRYIISVNLNFSNPVFALGNLSGEILNAFDLSIADGTPRDRCLQMVRDAIGDLLHGPGIDPGKVYCIAVAAPGVFDKSGRQLSYNAICGGPPWWEVDLHRELTSAFGLPVFICNDVKAATLGEWVKGAGERVPNLLYISAGLGIGAGIVLGGSLFLGEDYNAGEIFDYIDSSVDVEGPNLEDTICIEYLKSRCAALDPSPFPPDQPLTLDTITRAYSQGDPEVIRIVDEICRRLAIITYNFMNFISVRYVVLGGEYAPFGDCFTRHLTGLFEGSRRPTPQIRITMLGKFAGIQGMFCLARQRYFQDLCTR